MSKYILALDQGTTSSRAILFEHDGSIAASAQEEFEQILPQPGHVEHDPEAIWSSQQAVARRALRNAGIEPSDVAAIGVANQRETTILWERDSGRPVGNAIVWQSRVSAGICDRLRAEGWEDRIREKTGLVLDPYFSGTKIKYLLDHYSGLRSRGERGEILFGTVDSFLAWRLTGGRQHITDYSNASRTLLFNIHTLDWDDELLKMLGIPRAMLPSVRNSSEVYDQVGEPLFGVPLPLAGMAGDQQAATFGQACFEVGSAKNTYGTGSFLLMNTGSQPVASENRLLTTIGWGREDRITYCLEGSVFVSGAVVQWLRDGLGVISDSSEVEQLANSVQDSHGVVIVPAFVGLGAPHWDATARGSVYGITRGTRAAHLARAALESMAFQTRDLVEAMRHDAHVAPAVLKVDGGAAVNNTLLQFQADILDAQVQRPVVFETTALGAAYLAGLAVGFWDDEAELQQHWKVDRTFSPAMVSDIRSRLCQRWARAVQRTLGWEETAE
jgi:glycerol kinase